MRTRTVLLAVLVLTGAAVALFLFTRPAALDGPGRTPAREEPAQSALTKESGALEAASIASGEERAPVAGADGDAANDADVAGEAVLAPGLADARTVSVSGVVRWADDGEPVAHVSFFMRFSGDSTLVEADEQGRFVTRRVVEPGIVDLGHKRTDQAGRFPDRLLFKPASIVIPDGEPPSGRVEVELTLVRPAATVVALVVHRDGRSAIDTRVELELQHEIRPGEFAHSTSVRRTGEDGRVTFAVYDLERLRAAGLVARRVETLPGDTDRLWMSELVAFELPRETHQLNGVHQLVLDGAGSLLVRVVRPDSSPAANEVIALHTQTVFLSVAVPGSETTDEHGVALFEGLVPQEYEVRLRSGPSTSARKVRVDPGLRTELELVAPASRKELAAAGRVVDEEGAPLARVSVHATYGPRPGSGDTSATATTDDQGRFEFRAEPCDGVVVTASRDVFGDDFEPGSLEVAFGTTEAVFRRTRAVERDQIRFEIVDAATKERLHGALVMTYRAPITANYSFHRATEGLASPLCALRAETTLVVEHPGYRRASANLDDLRPRPNNDGLGRVELERGVLRRLRVAGELANGEDGRIALARVKHGPTVLGNTDASGEFLVDLYTWPEQGLTIEADGYTPATWMPRDGFAELVPAWVWLEQGE